MGEFTCRLSKLLKSHALKRRRVGNVLLFFCQIPNGVYFRSKRHCHKIQNSNFLINKGIFQH